MSKIRKKKISGATPDPAVVARRPDAAAAGSSASTWQVPVVPPVPCARPAGPRLAPPGGHYSHKRGGAHRGGREREGERPLKAPWRSSL